MGIRFDVVTEREAIDWVLDELDAGRGGWMVTPNLAILRGACVDERCRRLVTSATFSVADGMPLIWASRLQGTPLPERVAGSTLVSTLSAAAAGRGRSLFLIGGEAGTAARTCEILRERHPNIDIRGSYYPEFGFEKDPAQIEAIREAIREADADIVYIALSFPKADVLIEQIRNEFPKMWFAGIGISFSFICGDVVRAPKWIQKIGLEWMHRFVQEPKRLARRYFIEGLPFAARLLGTSFLRRFKKR